MRLLRTRADSRLEFDDTAGAAKVTLTMESGHEVVLDDGAAEITIRHSNGCVVRLTRRRRSRSRRTRRVDVTAPSVNVTSPMSTFGGVVTLPDPDRRASASSRRRTPPASGTSGERGFVLRAPWYVRERRRARRCSIRGRSGPTIQMYDGTDFVERLLADPRDSLQATADDRWSYPVPVDPSVQRSGRAGSGSPPTSWCGRGCASSTSLPTAGSTSSSSRCSATAGSAARRQHDDIQVGFVMRRRHTSITGERRPTRRLARNLLARPRPTTGGAGRRSEPPEDVRDVWWAEQAHGSRRSTGT